MAADPPLADPSRAHPGLTLNRWQLTLIILICVFGPFSIVVWMTSGVQTKPEEKLLATYQLQVIEWSDNKDKTPVLTPGIRVTNPTEDDWDHVSFALNKRFYYYHPKKVFSHETVAVPLSRFIVKNGTVAFDPTSQQVEMVTIFAQIPSGARAVFEEKVERRKEKGEVAFEYRSSWNGIRIKAGR